MAIPAPRAPSRVHPAAASALRTGAVTVLAGGASGLVAGGILGRLGMRLLALTSPDVAQGRLTDDAARVGRFTLGGSLTLALALAMAGAVLGLAYLLLRRVLPASRSQRIAGSALLAGAVGGSLLIHDHPSFDYSILQPTWLAVLLFIAVPATYGALLAYLVESFAEPDPPRFAGPVSRLWHSTAVTVAGTTAYWVLLAWGAYNIGADIVSLATDSASGAPFTI
jgi:uncharacterized membrane protein